MNRTKIKPYGLMIAVAMATALSMFPLSEHVLATEDPIPLIDVVVKKTPPGNGFTARTNSNGYLVFKSLAAGTYVVNDGNKHRRTFKHLGGPAKWKLFSVNANGKAVWTLMDDSNPL